MTKLSEREKQAARENYDAEARFACEVLTASLKLTGSRPTLSVIEGGRDKPSALHALDDLKMWVTWVEELRNGELTKVPKNPATGKNAQVPTNPSTYGTRAAAEWRWKLIQKENPKTKGGTGIVLSELPNREWLAGFDLDSCLTMHEFVDPVLTRFNTYTEISPSGKGFKSFFRMTASDMHALHEILGRNTEGKQLTRKTFGAGKHREVALDTARFYAVTGDVVHDLRELRLVPLADVQWFLEHVGPNYLKMVREEVSKPLDRQFLGKTSGPKKRGVSAQEADNPFSNIGASKPLDETRSGYGFRFMQDCHGQEMSFEEACTAIRADTGPAGEWAREKGDERQLKRAWEHSKPSPTEEAAPNDGKTQNWIEELNKRYSVVLEGGKVRVLTFSQQSGREMVNYLSFADFRNLHMNKYVVTGKDEKGNNTTTPLGAHWLRSSKRKQYEGVTFEPCKPHVIDGKLNLWRGWGIEPTAGDWSLMQQHIHEVLAAGDSEHDEYILKFAAWCVQHPDIPAEVALVFKGPEGTGRGIFARGMCRIFGHHAHQISSIKHLAGEFNKHLRDCCLLFADEAFWPGYRNQEGTLKRLITEPTLFIEPKGLDAFEVKNMLHLIMVSNNKWVIPASMDARRFAMFEVSDHKKQDAAWFTPLYQQMDNGGYAAMLHDLLKRDLADWHPRQVIRTEALYVQQMLSLDSLDPYDAWWYALLSDGILPKGEGWVTHEDGTKEMGDPNPRRALSSHLFEHARKCAPRLKFESDNALGHALREHGCKPFNRGGRGWEFPPLKEARAAWKVRVPGQEWDDDLEDWQERTGDVG